LEWVQVTLCTGQKNAANNSKINKKKTKIKNNKNAKDKMRIRGRTYWLEYQR